MPEALTHTETDPEITDVEHVAIDPDTYIPLSFEWFRGALRHNYVEGPAHPDVVSAIHTTVVCAQQIAEQIQAGKPWIEGEPYDVRLNDSISHLAELLGTHAAHPFTSADWLTAIEDCLFLDVRRKAEQSLTSLNPLTAPSR
jgi:hypothetical protein